MQTINYRRLFFKFLKENDLYTSWLCNLKAQHPISNKHWWNKMYNYIYGSNTKQAVDYAFCWANTSEGHDFWSTINDRWRRKVRELEAL